jgi:DNA-binding transcriptional regulator YdaS (Cro superfamily)
MLGSMITPDFVIDALGGTKAVAEALSLSPSTVSCWRAEDRRGIPSAHWLALSRLAAEKGVSEITLEALAELAAFEPVEIRA